MNAWICASRTSRCSASSLSVPSGPASMLLKDDLYRLIAGRVSDFPASCTRRGWTSVLAVGAVRAEQRGKLVLETTGLDSAVHAAFLGRSGLPPPSPRPRVVTFAHRAGAGRATDGLVALVVERVVGDVVGADIVPHFGFGPIGQRRELHYPAVIVIDFDLADIGAGRPLIAPEPRHPRPVVHQGAPERQHLAHLAAQQPEVDVLVEEVVAVP